MNNTKNNLQDRYALLSKLIDAITKKLPELPEGRLKIKCNRNKKYYFLKADNRTEEKMITDKDLIHSLAQKSYLQFVLKAAQSEYQYLGQIIDKYPNDMAEEVYSSLSQDRKELVQPITMSDEDYAKAWLAIDYKHKEIKEGTPFFTTLNGEKVKSKSEQIIADRFKVKGIPYKYECPLKLNSGTIHPDFTILKLSERKIIYLEHAGKMGEIGYCDKNTKRINNYAMNGILIGDKLFMTFETDKVPFDVRVLDKMIEKCFR